MKLQLDILSIKSAQGWDSDLQSLVATIKLVAKIDTKDLSDIGYLQTVAPPIQCVLSTDQLPMKPRMAVNKETGETDGGDVES